MVIVVHRSDAQVDVTMRQRERNVEVTIQQSESERTDRNAPVTEKQAKRDERCKQVLYGTTVFHDRRRTYAKPPHWERVSGKGCTSEWSHNQCYPESIAPQRRQRLHRERERDEHPAVSR